MEDRLNWAENPISEHIRRELGEKIEKAKKIKITEVGTKNKQ